MEAAAGHATEGICICARTDNGAWIYRKVLRAAAETWLRAFGAKILDRLSEKGDAWRAVRDRPSSSAVEPSARHACTSPLAIHFSARLQSKSGACISATLAAYRSSALLSGESADRVGFSGNLIASRCMTLCRVLSGREKATIWHGACSKSTYTLRNGPGRRILPAGGCSGDRDHYS
ncbi:hypothetical protein TARUN_10147 [Trichoderma arundinaceum]|uniref:Uncharacterized protein n=1 Tax=Trichoderma arundinaceum TaxID=490622 RepID=A0A395N8A6_TRIAR|nr:hypothetical protein TARUN_10147 [Trichoderma arundinaceum]